MIKIRIKEISKERGIKNAYRLQLAAQLSPAAASRFWKSDVEKISMETLGRLCKALGCQPGDLFVYEPKDASKNGHASAAVPSERSPTYLERLGWDVVWTEKVDSEDIADLRD